MAILRIAQLTYVTKRGHVAILRIRTVRIVTKKKLKDFLSTVVSTVRNVAFEQKIFENILVSLVRIA